MALTLKSIKQSIKELGNELEKLDGLLEKDQDQKDYKKLNELDLKVDNIVVDALSLNKYLKSGNTCSLKDLEKKVFEKLENAKPSYFADNFNYSKLEKSDLDIKSLAKEDKENLDATGMIRATLHIINSSSYKSINLQEITNTSFEEALYYLYVAYANGSQKSFKQLKDYSLKHVLDDFAELLGQCFEKDSADFQERLNIIQQALTQDNFSSFVEIMSILKELHINLNLGYCINSLQIMTEDQRLQLSIPNCYFTLIHKLNCALEKLPLNKQMEEDLPQGSNRALMLLKFALDNGIDPYGVHFELSELSEQEAFVANKGFEYKDLRLLNSSEQTPLAIFAGFCDEDNKALINDVYFDEGLESLPAYTCFLIGRDLVFGTNVKRNLQKGLCYLLLAHCKGHPYALYLYMTASLDLLEPNKRPTVFAQILNTLQNSIINVGNQLASNNYFVPFISKEELKDINHHPFLLLLSDYFNILGSFASYRYRTGNHLPQMDEIFCLNAIALVQEAIKYYLPQKPHEVLDILEVALFNLLSHLDKCPKLFEQRVLTAFIMEVLENHSQALFKNLTSYGLYLQKANGQFNLEEVSGELEVLIESAFNGYYTASLKLQATNFVFLKTYYDYLVGSKVDNDLKFELKACLETFILEHLEAIKTHLRETALKNFDYEFLFKVQDKKYYSFYKQASKIYYLSLDSGSPDSSTYYTGKVKSIEKATKLEQSSKKSLEPRFAIYYFKFLQETEDFGLKLSPIVQYQQIKNAIADRLAKYHKRHKGSLLPLGKGQPQDIEDLFYSVQYFVNFIMEENFENACYMAYTLLSSFNHSYALATTYLKLGVMRGEWPCLFAVSNLSEDKLHYCDFFHHYLNVLDTLKHGDFYEAPAYLAFMLQAFNLGPEQILKELLRCRETNFNPKFCKGLNDYLINNYPNLNFVNRQELMALNNVYYQDNIFLTGSRENYAKAMDNFEYYQKPSAKVLGQNKSQTKTDFVERFFDMMFSIEDSNDYDDEDFEEYYDDLQEEEIVQDSALVDRFRCYLFENKDVLKDMFKNDGNILNYILEQLNDEGFSDTYWMKNLEACISRGNNNSPFAKCNIALAMNSSYKVVCVPLILKVVPMIEALEAISGALYENTLEEFKHICALDFTDQDKMRYLLRSSRKGIDLKALKELFYKSAFRDDLLGVFFSSLNLELLEAKDLAHNTLNSKSKRKNSKQDALLSEGTVITTEITQ